VLRALPLDDIDSLSRPGSHNLRGNGAAVVAVERPA
jgi:hypothetical protein